MIVEFLIRKKLDAPLPAPMVIILKINTQPAESNAFVRAFTSIAKDYQDAVDQSGDFQGEQ